MRPPGEIAEVVYPVDGNKALEYHKPVRYAINGILHNVLQKGEAVQFIFVMTTGENSCCKENREIFIREFERINAEKGLLPSYADVEIPFQAVKQTYNKLITDLAEKVPENAEIYADMTFGSKPEVLSLFCALIFVENFRNAVIQYIVYGKAEFNKKTRALENPVIFDLTSLYYLFKVLGTMQSPDAGAALDLLKDFFAL
jgi:cobalamin biosynthesis Co2+ chelatase CbiK